MARLAWVLAGLSFSACCRDVGACPQNDVLVVVSSEGASVPVTIIGYDFECGQGEGSTVCRADVIAEGDYDLVVQAEGHAPVELTLSVRTNVAPAFSCECEVPSGSAVIDLGSDPAPAPDAGTPMPDGGTPMPDSG